MKVTGQLYRQFLLSSHVNYKGTYLAKHLAGLQHNKAQYFLKTSRFIPRQLWQQVRAQVVGRARGYVLFDDTVLDKRHRQRIELVWRQYSGNAHGIIQGIELITGVDVNAETDQFWLLT
ncbi:hypothetical protein GKZ68_21090 (plasmid) [Hymenobacter sp. BRD128]|uniref:hypothetical protein n=1 Tax=Hymenobacter sp. BRD128 TaxID=2675878 RepID=UPI0015657EDE|nr:hypothetical protein [Hymenobacter sp. BRD128]QKG59182.1 hypothetical protein GKZ68_21090 [Hymenobacter sp. BRD128]